MGSKHLIIIFLVIIALLLALTYFLFDSIYLFYLDTSICDNSSDNIDQKIYCYIKLASDNKDSRICNIIPKLIDEKKINDMQLEAYKSMAKESCKLQVIYATNSSDISQCEEFQTFSAACYYETVVESGKPEYCPKAYGAEVSSNDGEVYECLASIAIKKDDISICTNLDNSLGKNNIQQLCKNTTGKDCSNEDIVLFKDYKSEECLTNYASFSSHLGKLKPSVCGIMKTEQKNWCYALLASTLNNESYCENIPEEERMSGQFFNDRVRDTCIMAVAIKKMDIKICYKLEVQERIIEDYKIQNRCKNEVEKAIISEQKLKQIEG